MTLDRSENAVDIYRMLEKAKMHYVQHGLGTVKEFFSRLAIKELSSHDVIYMSGRVENRLNIEHALSLRHPFSDEDYD